MLPVGGFRLDCRLGSASELVKEVLGSLLPYAESGARCAGLSSLIFLSGEGGFCSCRPSRDLRLWKGFHLERFDVSFSTADAIFPYVMGVII